MKRVKSLIFLIFSCQSLLGQTILLDAYGRPLMENTYSDIKGNPCLFDEWKKGIITTQEGQNYQDLDLNYDQVKDRVLFKNRDGKTYLFTKPIKSFTIKRQENEELKFYFHDGKFYQLLVGGDEPLYKRTEKKVHENRTSYGAPTVIKTLDENVLYYFGPLKALKKLKLSRKEVLELLSKKANDIEFLMQREELNVKKESDLIRIFAFYNTVQIR